MIVTLVCDAFLIIILICSLMARQWPFAIILAFAVALLIRDSTLAVRTSKGYEIEIHEHCLIWNIFGVGVTRYSLNEIEAFEFYSESESDYVYTKIIFADGLKLDTRLLREILDPYLPLLAGRDISRIHLELNPESIVVDGDRTLDPAKVAWRTGEARLGAYWPRLTYIYDPKSKETIWISKEDAKKLKATLALRGFKVG